ncbi:putative major facilitator superfamily, MFS transporter superfamily [Helianthus annuus]|uniref:Major facilitator superfamily, MFS transporter superfamily n=1 Tax=Helianthus annuus TaxID=4232 RepID=A0A9K3NW06_HELAN|nr:probable sphingolipid transporter spinster homolog 2 [Helianthus annuus]KAF5814474.1 putative major facilitator superfamily, MFS transporter superfamily [Helianthus annuus]KAJ0593081.1 putative major facilitator superfamily, MFS transporter superfamily [Helianthus annuus]KAJ0600861.1 putative major facilitator superfamily, MFS transporter superfamily [Helianthus annuus]KAJ0608093.1 putative major facilitator superfamily, MFS transporter superfamily [Helianthus annuus]KAJ0768158.1 putative m
MGAAEEGSDKRVKNEEYTNPFDDPVENDSTDSLESSWFTPKRLLVLFCVINLVTYLDRGVIASTGVNGVPETCNSNGECTHGTGIQGEFKLNNFKDGILSSAFMVGLLLASPIFASMAKSFNPFRLIAVGLSVWTLSAIGCGISIGFWTITVCRMLVGVGEASFISLAAPFIDENAPVTQRSAWLGIFYMCIPTGVALGYVYGGLVGGAYGWRYAFFGEAILMLPFVIMGFFMSPLQLKGISHDKDATSNKSLGSSHFSRFCEDVKSLLNEKIYVVNVLGYISYNFVIGAYSYWGPKAGYSIYHMTDADLLFGGITIVGGIVGTLTGGFVLDYMNSTIPNAFKLLSIATFFGAVFCFAAFCFKDMYMFIVFFLIGEILVFATQGPVNFVSIHSVDPSLKPLAMAMSTVSIHVFGDVPSSPLVGVMQDKLKNWRKSTLILTSVLFLAAGIWSIGIFLPSVDRYNDDNENPTAPSNENKAAKKTAVSPEP